jgi:hypothetical protein
MIHNFNIELDPLKGPVSAAFVNQNCIDLQSAFDYIRHLPYGRNSDKSNLLTIFQEQKGTCSTKHAALKQMLDEQEFKGFELVLGIFKMDETYHEGVGALLKNYHLNYIPEAHNYLKFHGEIIDCTSQSSTPDQFQNKLMFEEYIRPDQIKTYKIELHKKFLSLWLESEKNKIPYTLEDIWQIREACISVLSQ